MTEWKAKRFWKQATVETEGDEFALHLDGRPVRTPGKLPLIVPTRALADAMAAEWDAQGEMIRPETMPFTRSANSAVEKVIPQRQAVIDMLAEYGDSDLVCYRAPSPDGLIARQAAAWDPLIAWSEKTFGAPLTTATGVMYVAQPAESLAALRAEVAAASAFELTGLHDLVALSGSLVIGLAAMRGAFPLDDLWALSRIDETWQQEQWGEDAEAVASAEMKRVSFVHAKRFQDLSRTV